MNDLRVTLGDGRDFGIGEWIDSIDKRLSALEPNPHQCTRTSFYGVYCIQKSGSNVVREYQLHSRCDTCGAIKTSIISKEVFDILEPLCSKLHRKGFFD